MPWSAEDAPRHTHAADTPEKRRVWARVANEALTRTGSEESAIREANAAVDRMHSGAAHHAGTKLLKG